MTDFVIPNKSDFHIDFSEFDDDDNEKNQTEEIDSLYTQEGKKIRYDDKTMLYYKTLRFRRMDPIFLAEIDDDKCFKFYHEWNPYTGERLGIDPYGPLCFHPDSLIKYFYENRLNDLWIAETEQNGIQYQGYYADAVGAGFDIYIQSRGFNPEKYLFRLPIIDCYWVPGMENEAVVTMGPVLTDEEVKQIDELAKKHGSYYLTQYGTPRPSLFAIKQLYDTAVSKKPPVVSSPGMSSLQLNELYAKANRAAVDKLKVMKG